jgi:ppGpp synthetase/RelA/SpoT-type nucleotidyltranferase
VARGGRSRNAAFLAWYSLTMPTRTAAAVELGEWIAERVADLGVAVDSVSARAKDLRSTRGKLRDKGYKRPATQMTDMIGVRIVLLFESEIGTVTDYLRRALDINKKQSRIAGEELQLAEFGYRSVHLIGRFRGRTMRKYQELKRPWVEVQVRSLLQHAWAATGHDYLYKGALSFPNFTKRRFYAIAGGLELFDREFDLIRGQRTESHAQWLSAFESGKRFGEQLDITGVSALFEHLYPGSKWSDMSLGRPLQPTIEVALMKCLKKADITTARDLRKIASTSRFYDRLRTLASAVGTSPIEVANFAKAVVAIGQRRPTLLINDFVELVEDRRLRDLMSL